MFRKLKFHANCDEIPSQYCCNQKKFRDPLGKVKFP